MEVLSQGGCSIHPADKRLAGQEVAFLLNSMKCRLQITTGAARSSILETGDGAATKTVSAALAVTAEKLLLDLCREGKDDKPKEYLSVSYDDPLFQELGMEYGNTKKNGHLVFVIPDAKRFMPSNDLQLSDNTTIKVMLDTYKAPDVAMHVQRILHRSMGDNCVVTEDDSRLAGQEVAFHLNSLRCRMQIAAAGGGSGKRSSIVGTADAPAERSVFAALVVTKEKLVLDLKRAGTEDPPKEYLCISYQEELCREVGLEYKNDAVNSHLILTLPSAKRFFHTSPGALDLPEDCTLKVFIDTWKAPDIVMHVKHQLKVGGAPKAETCEIVADDSRLASQNVEFILNNMKCRVQSSAEEKKRSSIIGTVERPATDKVLAALAVSDQKLVIDLKRIGAAESAMEYLQVAYTDAIFQDLSVEYKNDDRDSHLIVVLKNAGKFFKDSKNNIDVPEDATVRVYMDTWKAPDIAMFVRQHIFKNKAKK